jgi:hypothetical protein
MTRRTWIAALAVAVTAALAGCAPAADDAAPVPTFRPTPSASASTSAAPGLPRGREIDAWAAEALPEDRAGGRAPVLRMTGTLTTAPAAAIDVSQESGIWELLLTCQSEDASPIGYSLQGPTVVSAGPGELSCPAPDGSGLPSTAVIAFEGTDASLSLTATARAVWALEVRPHVEPGT